MSDAAAPSSPDPDGAAEDFARPALERQMAGLQRLAEIGLEIAEAVARQVRGSDTFDAPAVSLAYHRAARAVRMSYALQTEVIDQIRNLARLEAFDTAEAERLRAAEAAALHVALAPKTPTRLRKDRIGEALTDIIADAHPQDRDARERAVREASERLRDPDAYGDVLNRPMSEVIADICRDLGLEPDWQGLASRAWAIEEMQSEKVGAPLQSTPVSFSSPACGGGGPAQPVEGAQPPLDTSPSAPSVTAQERRATFPASEEGEEGVTESQPDTEPPPLEPYTPPCLEEIYAAPPRPPPPLGLPGELPPLRRDGRPAAYRPPPCNYTHGFD